ncbi:MAG: YraN family protein, partial [Flavonifractor plautii]
RSRFGEIDLIAATDKYLSFIEVKLRTEERFALGREAVDRRKQARLRATAELYLAKHPEEARQPRFDVAEIYAPQGTATRRPRITWLENAF